MKASVRFLRDESRAIAVKHGLIATGISLAIMAAVNRLGTKLSATFASINSSLTGGARRLARAESTYAS
ncbi:Flp family type IVb pilin [Bradyrhizobium sp. WSM 1744]|uniref:Flp family type IVb pilin n=1 Tax=Bradyrhizobium archetypum TaxID=2721160 RepID=A0A7Y4H9F9_9BRAD|nr:Flp family type IVb pilin [Bradyrhizobium archetypum]